MTSSGNISAKSKRVAKNTLLLYFRMLLLMLIGLFTSRIVLNALGVEDYGVYQVVYSAVMMFTVLSNSISSSVSRFMAFELGSENEYRLKKVFSSAVLIQLGLIVLLFVLAETIGLWYLNHKIVIPEGRETAAFWVFQTSSMLLAIQLLSLPFNCCIIAHEDMKAFAWISILEGCLKLGVALVLFLSSGDKLILYSILMVLVAICIRGTYASFCKRHYVEVAGKPIFDRSIVKQMLSFGAWSFTAHGAGVFNTQGVNLLSNSVFGVSINAIRGIAGQVENIVRQFSTNFLTAINPLIIKTWAEGNKHYCFELVRKGCKYSFLIVLLFALPFYFEADFILQLWLGKVPQKTGLFTTLAILCVLTDFMSNSLAQLIVANGKVAIFYSVTSAIELLAFIASFTMLRNGFPAETPYYIMIAMFTMISLFRLIFVNIKCGFPIYPFLKEVVFPLALTILASFSFTKFFIFVTPEIGIWKNLSSILTSMLAVMISAYFLALTRGERNYCLSVMREKLFRK